MYINGFFVLNWVRFQTLSGSPLPKYWSSTSPAAGVPGGWGAETNTILKTVKPLGREDPWNEEYHVTTKSHEPWTTANGTTRFVLVRFCMLSRFIEGKEVTTGNDKKEGVLFLLFRKVISPIRVLNTPLGELILNNEIKCACFTSFYSIFYVFCLTRWDTFVFVCFPFLSCRQILYLHRSKPLILQVPFNPHFHCFQG